MFVVGVLVLHLVISLVYVRVVGRGHKVTRSDRMVLRAPAKLDLVIAGDSHPRTALAPQLLGPRVINAAVGGEHYLKTYYRLRTLVERGGKDVSALLLPVDAGSFSSWQSHNFAPEFIWGRYVDFFEVGRAHGRPLKFTGAWVKSRAVPYAGELRTLNQIRQKRFGFGVHLPNANFGAAPEFQRKRQALMASQQHFRGADPLDPALRWAFDQLVAWAEEQSIRVVFVSFPVTQLYHRWAERVGARAAVQREILDPLREAGHLVLDHHDLYFGQDELFSDSHHLNAKGRIRYTRHVRERLRAAGMVEYPVQRR